jgi:hypothetical protein
MVGTQFKKCEQRLQAVNPAQSGRLESDRRFGVTGEQRGTAYNRDKWNFHPSIIELSEFGIWHISHPHV